ncbi:MAG: nuclear transport factor 2 family protein, partial [Prevotella sp.]|nr:nuclear transport factor 2 family protein [Prevotella sp.]
MRRLFSVYMALIAVITTQASAVNFTISNGIDNAAVKSRIENSVSRILNEINAAQSSGRSLNFAAMGVGTSVQQSMAMLWENTPFICTDEEIIEHCITTGTGYQVRNIPLMMKPTGEREFNEDEYQEAVISFDRQGNVESFYLSISMNLYMNVIKSNLELTDLRRRQMILDYVEQFRT